MGAFQYPWGGTLNQVSQYGIQLPVSHCGQRRPVKPLIEPRRPLIVAATGNDHLWICCQYGLVINGSGKETELVLLLRAFMNTRRTSNDKLM